MNNNKQNPKWPATAKTLLQGVPRLLALTLEGPHIPAWAGSIRCRHFGPQTACINSSSRTAILVILCIPVQFHFVHGRDEATSGFFHSLLEPWRHVWLWPYHAWYLAAGFMASGGIWRSSGF
jgi:hypothetical protein